MRLDHNARVLSVSVRELVHPEVSRRDLPFIPDRAALGRELHARRRLHRARHCPGWQGEVVLEHRFDYRGYEIRLRGRADGVYVEGDVRVVEEFKSVALEADELRGLCAADFPAALFQLEVYLYILSHREGGPVRGALVLTSIFDPDIEWSLSPPFERLEVERRLLSRLDEFLDHGLQREAHLRARRAKAADLPFPHSSPRPLQADIRREVLEALATAGGIFVEAPTGAGKSAAVLHAVLERAMTHDAQVFFLSARTTGQEAALKVMRAWNAMGIPLRTVQMTAREKVCRMPEVRCRSEYCEVLGRHQDRGRLRSALESLVHRGVGARSVLEDIADRMGLCPFEFSLDAISRADVVIADYNYVFDPSVALRDDRAPNPLERILILDEAHHVVERARAYWSPRFSWRLTADVEAYARARLDSIGRRLLELTAEVGGYFHACLEEAGLLDAEGAVPFHPDVERFRAWRRLLVRILLDDPIRRRASSPSYQEDILLRYYHHLNRFAEVGARLDERFQTFVERSPTDISLRIYCLDPSRAIGDILKKSAGFVAMSATLSPPGFFVDMLGVDPETPTARFESPFPSAHRRVLVVDHVPDRFRDRPRAIGPLVRVVQDVMAERPGTYGLYLPSFAFVRACLPALRAVDAELIVQEPEMSDEARDAIMRRVAAGPGKGGKAERSMILVAVMGGSLAEGVEWPHGVLSGIIVFGPGLPALGLERELIRRYFEERFGNGFEYAYVYPGMTRVIQAAGRLIRRREDRGVIVLVGRRFSTRPYRDLIPREWWDEGGLPVVSRGELREALRAFWMREARPPASSHPSF